MFISILQENQYYKALAYFVEKESKRNENFMFWWQYIEMFSILLLFTHAQQWRRQAFQTGGALHSMEDSRGGTRKNKRQKNGTTL